MEKYPPSKRGTSDEERERLLKARALLIEKQLLETQYKVICDLEFVQSGRHLPYRPKANSGVILLPFTKEYKCKYGYLGNEQMHVELLTAGFLTERPPTTWR
jgi:hypothetical protein